MLKLFYSRTRMFYAEHFIFAVHFLMFTALFALFIPVMARFIAGALAQVVSLLVAVYLFLALKRVYKQSILATAAKTAGLFISYTLVAAPVGTVVLVWVTLWLM